MRQSGEIAHSAEMTRDRTSTEVFASGVVPLDCTSDAEGETCMQDSTVQLS